MRQPEMPPLKAAKVIELPQDFSLVLGGPLYQLYLRTRMARPGLELMLRRVVIISMICWLPLLLLTTFSHQTEGVTFLRDPEVQVRFLFALPLLIVAEVLVHIRLRPLVPEFLGRGIIAPQDQPRFEQIVSSAMRLRNSVVIEVLLLVLVVTLGHRIWRQRVAFAGTSWYGVRTAAGLQLTAAGTWYAFVSLSIFRFILYRWYFRLFIWYRFLWQVRSLPLHLNLYHPDNVGGLGFLAVSLPAFAPIFVAQTAVLAAFIYSRILYANQTLPAFKMEIVVAVALCVVVTVLPLTFFSVRLESAARIAKLEFGNLASHYVDDFRGKWVLSGSGSREPLLGTPDIQSLADLANSYNVVRDLRVLPITKQNLIRLVVAIAFPLAPLVLTMFPLDEILKRLLKLF